MLEGYLLMSASERDRSHLVRRIIEKSLSRREAAERLGIGIRQIKRLVRAWKRQGDHGRFCQGSRQNRRNRQYADEFGDRTVMICCS